MFGLFKSKPRPSFVDSINAPLLDRIKAAVDHPDLVAQIHREGDESGPAIERFRCASEDRSAAFDAIIGKGGNLPARHATRPDHFANYVRFVCRNPIRRGGQATYEFVEIDVTYKAAVTPSEDSMIKASKYAAGYHFAIGKALGLGDRPYRSLEIREAHNEIVTVTVEFIMTTEQAGKLIEVIEERRFFLVESKDPIKVSVTQQESGE